MVAVLVALFAVASVVRGYELRSNDATGTAPERAPAKLHLYIDDSDKYAVAESYLLKDRPLATATYHQNVGNSGFNYLDITSTTPEEGALLRSTETYLSTMRAMGYLEGYLTCDEIATFYPNFYSDSFGSNVVPSDVKNFIESNYAYALKQAEAEANEDSEYWQAIRGTLAQLNGMVEGFEGSPCAQEGGSKFTLLQALYVNAWGDLYTIQTKFMLENATSQLLEARRRGDRNSRLKYHQAPHVPKELRCSSLFRLLPDYSDIIFGHVTWDGFEALGPRIFKRYKLPNQNSIYFSASPATISSVDDFYVVLNEDGTTQLGVIETTNEVYNPELFPLVQPTSVLSWMRVMVANTLATDGPSWSQYFSTHPSGTYTNQWQVLDMNLFQSGQTIPPENLFTIVEEIPGTIVTNDLTQTLYKQMYWASYNIPYFDEIYIKSGNKASCELGKMSSNSTDNCYEDCPRANIFRAQFETIATLSDMQYIINFNKWQTDPDSEGDPCKAIGCRKDLEPNESSSYPAGGLDGKVSSIMKSMTKYNQDGPTIMGRVGPSDDDQPPFCWSNVQNEEEFSHYGQPNCFQYEWTSLIFSQPLR